MISLIHPSRGRPEKSFDNSKEWVEKAGCEVELIISLDSDDPKLDLYKQLYQVVATVTVNDNISVVRATNIAARHTKGDILLYLSDDFKCFPNWGIEIEKTIGDVTKPILLKIDDCLQDFKVGVLTCPIMTRALYNMLHYFWHPDYLSMHVDVDLFETCKRLGVIKYAPQLKFPHEHVSNGKAQDDDTYRRSSANWDQGLRVIKERRRAGFPI